MPQSDPSLAASLAQSVEPVSVKQVLHTTSLLKVDRIVEGMRTAVRAGASVMASLERTRCPAARVLGDSQGTDHDDVHSARL